MHLPTKSRWTKPCFLSLFLLTLLISLLPLTHLSHISAFQINTLSPLPFCLPEWRSLPTQPYHLDHLLNLPSFRDPTVPVTGISVWNRSQQVACQHPASVLHYYHSIPSTCARQPYLPFLKEALKMYGKDRIPERFFWIVSSGRALLVQFDPDAVFSDHFKERFTILIKELTTVVLMPASNSTSTARSDELRRLAHQTNSDVKLFVRTPLGWDDDLLLMSHARLLLLHTGPKSALGALVAPATVYYTAQLKPYTENNQFKWLINDGHQPRALTYQQGLNFRAIGPVVPSCCKFQNFGHGDGEKVVCANARAILKPDKCWVLSIGCQGKFDFEEDIVKSTMCNVHIFDCTGSWAIPPSLKGRATLSKICIGKPGQVADGFVFETMVQIIARASKLSGFREPTLPALLKMDVEGFEIPVFKDIVANTPDKWLPEQMAVEIHLRTRKPVGLPYELDRIHYFAYLPESTLIDIFGNLSNRGYQLVHRADNPFCQQCSEITLLHRSGMPVPVARN